MGTLIWGSSSRGVYNSAISPASRLTRMMMVGSLDSRKTLTRRAVGPRWSSLGLLVIGFQTIWDNRPRLSMGRRGRLPHILFLVPKLLLGNLFGCEALLRSGNGVPPHLGSAKRSLAGNGVPKPELGNEKAKL